jgi:hypothetical protein
MCLECCTRVPRLLSTLPVFKESSYAKDTNTGENTTIPTVLLLHRFGTAMAMHGYCRRIKPMHKFKMIIGSQFLLVLYNDKLVIVNCIS